MATLRRGEMPEISRNVNHSVSAMFQTIAEYSQKTDTGGISHFYLLLDGTGVIMHGYIKILIRGGEWSFKNSRSRKFLSQISRVSQSRSFVSQNRFLYEAVSESRIFAKGFEVPSHLGIRFLNDIFWSLDIEFQ